MSRGPNFLIANSKRLLTRVSALLSLAKMDEMTRVYEAALASLDRRDPCAVVTVVETSGSIPRAVGAKMLVYPDSRIVGTVGGGKFESLVIADAVEAIRSGGSKSETYPLHEGDVMASRILRATMH